MQQPLLTLSSILDAPIHEHAHGKICSSSLTYRQAGQARERHRRWLQRHHHNNNNNARAGQETIVAYLGSNSMDYLLSVLACSSTSTTSTTAVVPALLNTRWTVAEMVLALQGSRGILLYTTPEWKEKAEQVVQQLKPHYLKCIQIPDYCVDCNEYENQERVVEPPFHYTLARTTTNYRHYSTEPALIVFTSGSTTGQAKGVVLSHRALAVQIAAKLQFYSGATSLWASALPLFHIGGWTNICATVMAGGTLDWSNPSSPWMAINSGTVNTLVVVPAMVHSIKQQYMKDRAAATTKVCPHVQMIMVGGQSLQSVHTEFLRTTFPRARIVQTYACSEAASSLTFYPVVSHHHQQPQNDAHSTSSGDCVGRPPPHVELRLLDSAAFLEQGKAIDANGCSGILATRGPHVMNGYWNKQTPSPKYNPAKWYVTGDLLRLDPATRLWYFLGRIHDSIRTGGETVLASAVEHVIRNHPAVEDCAVFGLPDERFGSAVSCAILCKSGQSKLSVQELRTWCARQGLAGYKRPRQLYYVDIIPKNVSGKVLKFQLVKMFGSAHFTAQSKL